MSEWGMLGVYPKTEKIKSDCGGVAQAGYIVQPGLLFKSTTFLPLLRLALCPSTVSSNKVRFDFPALHHLD